MRPGGRAENRGAAFELFVLRILEQDPEIELAADAMPYGPHGFDVLARRNGEPLLVNAKQTTPQTAQRLKQLDDQLKSAAAQYAKLHRGAAPELALACAGVLSEPMRDRAAQSELQLWDGPYLSSWAQRLGVEVPPYLASESPDANGRADSAFQYTHSLLSRLNSIPPGQQGWSSYEKYCEGLLNVLFVPHSNPRSRKAATPRTRTAATISFLTTHSTANSGNSYEFTTTHYVVAEVKDLSSPPGKEEILQVANYLNPRGTGLFALACIFRDLGLVAWRCG
jgi:hypothetical protein